MRPLWSKEEAKFADQKTYQEKGISSLDLMFLAGKKMAEWIRKHLPSGKMLVLCGSGGNGGDGYVVAECLRTHFDVSVYPIEAPKTEECCYYAKKYRGKIEKELSLSSYDYIVDAMYGISYCSRGEKNLIFSKVNQAGKKVIALDLPSGLEANTGKSEGIIADTTLTVQEYKRGMILQDGRDVCGTIVRLPLGISSLPSEVFCLEKKDVKVYLPKRKHHSHKGSYGKIYLMGGSRRFLGAGYLSYSSLAAMRVGSGYSVLCVPESLAQYVYLKAPEIPLCFCKDNEGEFLFDEAFLKEWMTSANMICLGMGMGRSEEVEKIVAYLLTHFEGKLLLDADGWFALKHLGLEILLQKRCELIVTPHLKEFADVVGDTVSSLQEHLVEKAKTFASTYHLTLVLKDCASVITDGEQVFINPTGSPTNAKAGSGDMLSGIIAGLWSYQKKAVIAGAVGSYILGACGERLQKEQGSYACIATDVLRILPRVMKSLEGK